MVRVVSARIDDQTRLDVVYRLRDDVAILWEEPRVVPCNDRARGDAGCEILAKDDVAVASDVFCFEGLSIDFDVVCHEEAVENTTSPSLSCVHCDVLVRAGVSEDLRDRRNVQQQIVVLWVKYIRLLQRHHQYFQKSGFPGSTLNLPTRHNRHPIGDPTFLSCLLLGFPLLPRHNSTILIR